MWKTQGHVSYTHRDEYTLGTESRELSLGNEITRAVGRKWCWGEWLLLSLGGCGWPCGIWCLGRFSHTGGLVPASQIMWVPSTPVGDLDEVPG